MNLDLLKEKLKLVSDLEFIGLKFISDFQKLSKNENIFYIIGNDYEDKIGIKDDSKEVFSISDEEVTFINSSFENLIDCIIFFNETIDLNEVYNENKRRKSVEIISIKFQKIDKYALQENSWWSYILEQVEEGSL